MPRSFLRPSTWPPPGSPTGHSAVPSPRAPADPAARLPFEGATSDGAAPLDGSAYEDLAYEDPAYESFFAEYRQGRADPQPSRDRR